MIGCLFFAPLFFLFVCLFVEMFDVCWSSAIKRKPGLFSWQMALDQTSKHACTSLWNVDEKLVLWQRERKREEESVVLSVKPTNIMSKYEQKKWNETAIATSDMHIPDEIGRATVFSTRTPSSYRSKIASGSRAMRKFSHTYSYQNIDMHTNTSGNTIKSIIEINSHGEWAQRELDNRHV